MLIYIGLAAAIILTIKFLQKIDPSAKFGIYRKPGKWYFLKLTLVYVLLKTRKIIGKLYKPKLPRKSGQSGYGFKSRISPEDMDKQQPLSDHPKAIDAVYFNAANHNGYHLVVGTAHRPHGVVNGFVYLKVPDIGVLMTSKLPDTLLFRTKDDGTYYGAEGIEVTPLKPMKSWKIKYAGKMKLHSDTKKTYDVALRVEFSSSLLTFDFDTDMDELSVARAMATEPWSKEYLIGLRDFHQTHYEQHGSFQGEVVIDGVKYLLHLDGARDHSYGHKREWCNFHRYALHFITLENGARINIGIVCAPVVFSRVELGYLYKPDGTLLPVEWCDLKLEMHGENGTPPLDYGFSFQAGGDKYHVQVEVTDSPQFFVGWEWEARVVERLARYTVNGIAGWGAAEWEYRHLAGRPATVADTDPTWTHNLTKG